MSSFRPPRASPLLKPEHSSRDINSLKDSRSSSVSVPELVALTGQEIEFIETVIERASPTATTFLTILKVYNDLLQERGIDPQNEVVYFGKLLKLGTVKGKNWKEKWNIVKNYHGYKFHKPQFQNVLVPAAPRTPRGSINLPRRTLRFQPPDPETDTFTLDSRPEDTELAHSTYTDSEIDDPQYHATPRTIYPRSQSVVLSVATSSNSLGIDLGGPASYPSAPSLPQQHRRHFVSHRWDAQGSDSTDFAPTQISTPPSYGAALRDSQPEPLIPSTYANFRARYIVEPPLKDDMNAKSPALVPDTRVKERRDNVINEDEAWNNIKMLRDEEDADRFRDERLVERCWDVWRQGCQWIKVGFRETPLI
jgi:protein SFI1